MCCDLYRKAFFILIIFLWFFTGMNFLTHLLQLCHIYYILCSLENFPKFITLIASHFIQWPLLNKCNFPKKFDLGFLLLFYINLQDSFQNGINTHFQWIFPPSRNRVKPYQSGILCYSDIFISKNEKFPSVNIFHLLGFERKTCLRVDKQSGVLIAMTNRFCVSEMTFQPVEQKVGTKVG